MKARFSLSIPNPCSEDWNSFTPTSTGEFCGSCQKNVIDFTKATDDEIIAFINKKPQHVCGRFRGNQLKTYELLRPNTIQPGYTLLKAGALSLLLLFVGKQASAQTPLTKPTTEIVQQPAPTSSVQKKSSEIIIKGILIDADEKLPLAGAIIFQKGTVNGTVADAEGKYELKIDRETGSVLVFSFLGLVTEEVTLPDSSDTILDISLALETDVSGLLLIMGEVQTEGLYREQSDLKRFWNKIKSWF